MVQIRRFILTDQQFTEVLIPQNIPEGETALFENLLPVNYK